jgi:hypothetical protein
MRLGLALLWLASRSHGYALGQAQYVENTASPGAAVICAAGRAAALDVDTNDFSGVLHAAEAVRADLAQVAGTKSSEARTEPKSGTPIILAGTLGRSRFVDELVRAHKIDPAPIAGKWETFMVETVEQPLPGVDRALVICGSDERGTIYGLYDLSEQLGVSPWHYFADVPMPHREAAYARAGKYVQGPPVVKYRGIFLNDEAPDLSGWARAKFGGFNHGFYTNVFDLLLRLKANYLWPAMWNNCFAEDDPLNLPLAAEYGVVMGTSHVEPMMRADKEWNRLGRTEREWNFQTHSNELGAFWRAGLERSRQTENVVTIGMRGKIDTPMSATANIALLEEIVAAQRNLVAEVYHTNAAAVPQLWALYKEVQEYYEQGMRVPDDVTLLWSDDNWGNLRRLPPPEDRQRAGGSGIYYHFDYVGSPRNYKWVNSTALPRVWEQMRLAQAYGANRIWIANVGHLQHVQLPTEFFLTLAWQPERWTENGPEEFTRLWAVREFGAAHATQIANLVSRLNRFQARRKPELLSPETFSVVNYQEADRVLADWQALATEAQQVSEELPSATRDAFFELVLYPAEAGANLNDLYISVAKNRLYAAQGRACANLYADEVKTCFAKDSAGSHYYNRKLAGGKWNHMMDQTHIGYAGWQQPAKDLMPAVTRLALGSAPAMGIAVEGLTNVWPGETGEASLPVFDKFNQPTRRIEVFSRSAAPCRFRTSASASWILLNSTNTDAYGGSVEVSLDWKNVPSGSLRGSVTITSGTDTVKVAVPIFNPSMPARTNVSGFVEAGGCVVMQANHYTAKVDVPTAHWEVVDGLGNEGVAMTIAPVTAPSVLPPAPAARLDYQMYLFTAGAVQITARLAPTLNFVAGRGLRFGLSLDDAPRQIIIAVPDNYGVGDGHRDWEKTVSDQVRQVTTPFYIAQPGEHTVKFWMVDPGVVLEKIIVDCGGVKPSYLGPPESFHCQAGGEPLGGPVESSMHLRLK